MTKNKTLTFFCGLVTEFFFYSLIGWLYETILTSIAWGEFAKRGFLHLPFLPIYGFIGLFLVMLLAKLKSIPVIFLAGTAITTVAELAASYLIDIFLNKPLWNYSHWDFNFEGRISLYSSLIFGLLCVLLLKLLHPMMKKINEKISGIPLYLTALTLLLAIFTDLIITITLK